MGNMSNCTWTKPLTLKVYPDCANFPQSQVVDNMQYQMDTFLARGWTALFAPLQHRINLYTAPNTVWDRPCRAFVTPVQEINSVMTIAMAAATYAPVFEGVDDSTLIPQAYNMFMNAVCDSLRDYSLQEIGKRSADPYPPCGPDFDMSVYFGTRLLFRKSFRAKTACVPASDHVKMYFNFDGLSAGLLKYLPNRIEDGVVVDIPHLVFQLSKEGFFRAPAWHAEEKLSRPSFAYEGTLHTLYVAKVCLERIRKSLLCQNKEGWQPWDDLYFGRQIYVLKPSDKRMSLEFVYQGLLDLDPWDKNENLLNFMMCEKGPDTRPILHGYPLTDDTEGEDNAV